MKTFVFLLIPLVLNTAQGQWRANGVAVVDTSLSGRNALLPVVASDGSGGAYVVWRDARNGTDYDIYAQHIDSNGTMLWQRNGVPIAQAPYNQNFPRVCSDGNGGAFFAWEDDRSALHTNVYAQRIAADGVVSWQTNGVKVAETEGGFISIAADGRNGLLVAFEGLPANNFDAYAQRLDASGNRIWGDSGAHISTRPENLSSGDIRVVDDKMGGAIVAWIEGNGTYAQRIDSIGTMEWDSNGVSLSGSSFYSRFALGMVPDDG